MRRINKKLIVFILIICISIGFAYLSTNLSIIGVTNVKGNTWDIHFDNVQVLHSVDGNPTPTISSDKATVNYTANLNVPGDYFEFTVDVVNAGTVDAMIEEITTKFNNNDISNMPDYLDFSITYNDGIFLANNQLLEHGTTETLKIKVEFIYDINEDSLPSSNITHDFTTTLKYQQSNENSIERPTPYNVYSFIWDSSFNIGDSAPTGEDTTTSLEGIESSIGRWHCFLKHEILNNQITKNSIIFIIDDQKYEISSSYYKKYTRQHILEILNTAFGESNCSDTQYGYTCVHDAPTYTIRATLNSDGQITIWQNGVYEAVILIDGSAVIDDIS